MSFGATRFGDKPFNIQLESDRPVEHASTAANSSRKEAKKDPTTLVPVSSPAPPKPAGDFEVVATKFHKVGSIYQNNVRPNSNPPTHPPQSRHGQNQICPER